MSKRGVTMDFEELQELLQNLTNSKITFKKIADSLGVKLSTISTRKGKGSKVKFDEIKRIEKYFDVCLTDSACQTARLIEQIEADRTNIELANIEYFPDVYLSAGYGVEVLDEYSENVVIDERFLLTERGMRVNPKNCKMVRVSGNSMFPEYHHGDRVIIDESDTNLTDGQIYAFRYDGQCYVKEINRAGNKIKCISVNKEYEPFYIDRDVDFKVFGRILPRIRL
jgi:YD repeat-containing protein